MFKIGSIDGQPILFEQGEHVDDFGIKHTTCEFVKRRPNGTRVRIPIAPEIVVMSYARSDPFPQDQTREISWSEAKRMFRKYYQTIAHA